VGPYRMHQYAKTVHGEWVNALSEARVEGVTYVCDCPERHRMKLVKPLGREDRRPFSSYFAHIAMGWRGICNPSGEGVEHRAAKHALREWMAAAGDARLLLFDDEVCTACGAAHTVCLGSHQYEILLEQWNSGKDWRYDCLVVRRDDERQTAVYALEVVVTHWSSTEKMQGTRAEGVGIAEFKAHEVLAQCAPSCSVRRSAHLKNQSPKRIRRCAQCINAADNAFRHRALESEWSPWQALADAQRVEYARLHLVRQDAEALERNDRKRAQQLEEMQVQLRTAGASIQEKALCVVCVCGECVDVASTRWGLMDLGLRRESPTRLGFCIQSDGRDGIALDFFVLVVESAWTRNGCERLQEAITTVWREHSIPREHLVAIAGETVLRHAGALTQAYRLDRGASIPIKDCLFAMLMEAENEHQLCATCGLQGHRSSGCRQRLCVRCGRRGHSFAECFARKSIHGLPLPRR
jgi:hypothetical protein